MEWHTYWPSVNSRFNHLNFIVPVFFYSMMNEGGYLIYDPDSRFHFFGSSSSVPFQEVIVYRVIKIIIEEWTQQIALFWFYHSVDIEHWTLGQLEWKRKKKTKIPNARTFIRELFTFSLSLVGFQFKWWSSKLVAICLWWKIVSDWSPLHFQLDNKIVIPFGCKTLFCRLTHQPDPIRHNAMQKGNVDEYTRLIMSFCFLLIIAQTVPLLPNTAFFFLLHLLLFRWLKD